MQNNVPNVRPLTASNKMPILIIGSLIVIIAGLGVGYMIAGKKVASSSVKNATNSTTQTSTGAGAKDASSFKDTATGTLQMGGIKGEGIYHLDRPGGAEKTVYLNSTVIDMGPFVGKKVQVWGETVASKSAPWLMDVGKIQVVQ